MSRTGWRKSLRSATRRRSLRDGRHVETYTKWPGSQPGMLISKMVGRAIEDIFHYRPRRARNPGARGAWVCLAPVARAGQFSVAKGEIVGFFGLVGAGRSELLKLIYGAERAVTGSVAVHGQPVHFAFSGRCDPRRSHPLPGRPEEGGHRPDPLGDGKREPERAGSIFEDGLFHRREARARECGRTRQALAVKTPSLAQLIVHLSGGNQQKVILARWLSEEVKVILLDEPTRGHRRRRQKRDLFDHLRPRGAWHRRRRCFERTARSHGHLRPDHRHAPAALRRLASTGKRDGS